MTVWEIAEQFEFKEVKKACLKYVLDDLGKKERAEREQREAERLAHQLRTEEEERKRKLVVTVPAQSSLEVPTTAPVEQMELESEGERSMEIEGEGDELQSAGKKRKTETDSASLPGQMDIEAEDVDKAQRKADKGKEKAGDVNATQDVAVISTSTTAVEPREKGDEYKEICRKLIFEVLEKKMDLPKKFRSVRWKKEDAPTNPLAKSTSGEPDATPHQPES